MAHFAELNSDGVVLNVVVVDNFRLGDDVSKEEEKGIEYLNSTLGERRWVQTSFSGSIRGRFASIGGSYDDTANVFIDPQPFASWVLGADHEWHAPVDRPESGVWFWNEDELEWVEGPE